MYDFLIVGSGLFGAVFAHEAASRGKKCLVIDRRRHAGGNVYCERVEGIVTHHYGPHIFHTSDARIWHYVNALCPMRPFVNAPMANYRGALYNLPFNMNTFVKLLGTRTPAEARAAIEAQQSEVSGAPKNLEQQAIRMVGRDIYETLIKGYTEKQWGRDCASLPPSIIRRLPVRYTFDNNYYSDTYQGVPTGGYNGLIDRLLGGAEVRLGVDYLADRAALDALADRVVYTGAIDAYFSFQFGALEYRSLRFEREILDVPNHQGVAVVNYTDRETPFTRIIEHKHFAPLDENPKTVVTREYPAAWTPGAEPYYPIADARNQALYARYARLAEGEARTLFGGRLAQYRYMDMDQVVAAALDSAGRALGEGGRGHG